MDLGKWEVTLFDTADRGAKVLIDDEAMSRWEVMDRARRLARGLQELGVTAGSVVCLLLRNDFAFLYAGMAARLIGAHVVLMSSRSKPSEVAYITRNSGASIVIGHAGLLWHVRDVIPPVPVLVVRDDDERCHRDMIATVRGAMDCETFMADREPLGGPSPGATEAIIYTSGTTGLPKGVKRFPLDPECAALNGAEMSRIFGIRNGSRVLALGPLYHSMPDTASKLALEMADLLVIQRKFDAERALQQIEAHAITEVTLVPTMFVRLLKLPPEVRGRYDTSSLRTVTHTGAPCPPNIKQAMIEWWGPVIHELYGATEVGVTFFVDSHDWLRKPGTVGRAMPHTDFAILDAQGRSVGAGEAGEVFACNRIAPDWEYIGSERQMRADGLISVGDIGFVDEDGFLFLCDRKNDMIISGGINIYPAEIEAVVITFPDVLDCAVFGVPHDEFGEQAVLAVTVASGERVDPDALLRFARERLADHKVPRIVEVRDTLPRTESGKILRRALRVEYEQARAVVG